MIPSEKNSKNQPDRILRKLSYTIIGLGGFSGVILIPLYYFVQYAELRVETFVFPGANNVLIILVCIAVITLFSVLLVYRFRPDKAAAEKITILTLLMFIIYNVLYLCRLITIFHSCGTSCFMTL